MATTITIPRRFCGPPDSGNGGYVCGRLASFIDGPAVVRLKVPTPLDEEMEVRPADGGVDLDELGDATRDVSAVLDEMDPMPGRYTLSVSSPGLERRLRTQAHFARAVGETVTVRLDAGTPDVRRVTGTLEAAGENGFTLAGPEVPEGSMEIAYGRVERARTVFEWGPQPKRATRERVKRP